MTTGRLGKLAPKRDFRTLQLAKYLTTAISLLPVAPTGIGWNKPKNWGMMLNDSLGDCTCAAMGHMIYQWTSYTKPTPTVPPDAAILTAYEAVSGYVPGDTSTDNGATCIDALNYWRNTGVDGHRIYAYVQVDLMNTEELKQAIAIFGNVYLGIALPLSAQQQTTWTVPSEGTTGDGVPGSWGGHCIPIVAYDAENCTAVSWGNTLEMSWEFLQTYGDEAYAVLSLDWVNHSNVSPSHFNFTTLNADLGSL